MKNSLNILAIIPARAGSKRIPDKNIKKLGDKPLIAYTIETAIQANCFSHIIVSTDSEKIRDVALHYGADVPFLRSNNISGDDADVIDAIIEILNRSSYSNINAVMLLQPTSPFRTVKNIQDAVHIYKLSNENSVISVHKSNTLPQECMQIDSSGCLTPFFKENTQISALDTAYILNGCIYLSSVKTILTTKNFYSKHTEALVLKNRIECIDIDVIEEWHMSEYLINLSKHPIAI